MQPFLEATQVLHPSVRELDDPRVARLVIRRSPEPTPQAFGQAG